MKPQRQQVSTAMAIPDVDAGVLGSRYGNRSDTCVSVGFSRATSERPHHEVIVTRPDDWRTRSEAELRQVMGSTLTTAKPTAEAGRRQHY